MNRQCSFSQPRTKREPQEERPDIDLGQPPAERLLRHSISQAVRQTGLAAQRTTHIQPDSHGKHQVITALFTLIEVLRDVALLLLGEHTLDIPRNQLLDSRAFIHANASPSCCFAWNIRDFTVPVGIPNIEEISPYESPS